MSAFGNTHGIEYLGIYWTEFLGLVSVVLAALCARDIWQRKVSLDPFFHGTLVLAAFIAVSGMLLGVGAYFTRQVHDRRIESASHVLNVARAMLDYQAKNGRLPTWAVYDDKGRPLLSWRVLLLPYLGQKELYDEFHLNEPWDSSHNAQLLSRIPPEYRPVRSVRRTPQPYNTFIHVFTGKGTAFEGTKGLRIPDDFPDDPRNTILVLEGGEPVPWTKPHDIAYAADQPLPELATVHPFDVYIAVTDGSVRTISKETSEKTVRAAITRNGHDYLGPDW
jgi:hypothetical protein